MQHAWESPYGQERQLLRYEHHCATPSGVSFLPSLSSGGVQSSREGHCPPPLPTQIMQGDGLEHIHRARVGHPGEEAVPGGRRWRGRKGHGTGLEQGDQRGAPTDSPAWYLDQGECCFTYSWGPACIPDHLQGNVFGWMVRWSLTQRQSWGMAVPEDKS